MNYTILQQINPTFRVTEEENIKKEEYKPVYSGTIEEGDLNINQILENIFIKFNVSHPEGFKGHSLSTSDIVILDNEAYLCDMVGWKKVNLI